MWGGPEGSKQSAENWAAAVEAQSFEDEENYAEAGVSTGFSSRLKAGNAMDGNIEAGYNSGRRYTKQSIEESKSQGSSKRGLDFGSAYAQGSMTVFGKGAEVFVKKTWNQTDAHEDLEPGIETKAKLIGIDVKDIFPDMPELTDLMSLPDFPTLLEFLNFPDLPDVLAALKKMLPNMPDLLKYLPTLQIKFPDINFLDLPSLDLPNIEVPEEIKELIRQAQSMVQEAKDKMTEALEKAQNAEEDIARLMAFTKTVYQKADEKDDKQDAQQKQKSAKIGNKIDALTKAPGVGTALSSLGISNPVESKYSLELDYRVKPELSDENTIDLPFAEMVVKEENEANIGAIPFMSIDAKRSKQWMKLRVDTGGWAAV